MIRYTLVALALGGFGLAPALAAGNAAPATSVPHAVSISNRAWSGEIDDAASGRGTLTIRFSSGGGTFAWSSGYGTHTGTIVNFAQTSDQQATFVLHLVDAAGCDYNVTSYIKDGHLKGFYRGCGRAHNSGSFDLTSNGCETAQGGCTTPAPALFDQTSRSLAKIPTRAQNPFGLPASIWWAQNHPTSPPPPCVITGSVKWGTSAKGIEEGVPTDEQHFGGALEGARVTLIGKSTSQVAQTDVHGAFRFTAPVGSYTIEVQSSGYASQRDARTVEHPLTGSNFGKKCLDVGFSMRFNGVDPHLTAAQKANLARIGAANASQNAIARRISDAVRLSAAYGHAVNAYCRKSTLIACAYYETSAAHCFGEAATTPIIFGRVAMFKQMGLSSRQAIENIAEYPPMHDSVEAAGSIATAAAHIIDHHEHVSPSTLARAVFQVCVKNITR